MRRELQGLLVPLVLGAAPSSLQPELLESLAQQQLSIVSRLNQRFAEGRPSDSLEDAGVVFHQFDEAGFEAPEEGGTFVHMKTIGVSHWNPWLPCPAGLPCSQKADRFSASVANARMPYLFSDDNAGVIIAPRVASNATMCNWAGDSFGYHVRCGRI